MPLNELIVGDRLFQIPTYQRQYSWESQQLEDFWDDLYYLDQDKKHYFGTVILKETPDKTPAGLKTYRNIELIDGQQRITTVLILLSEIIECLKDEVKTSDDRQELDKMREDYLKYKGVYKLNLLGDDDEYFRENIVDGKDFPNSVFTPSRRRLFAAKTYFREKLKHVRETDPKKFKSFLLGFKAKLDNLEIIRYPVDKEEDAVLIFETVNDRGKVLSRLEKTKSFLMHITYLCQPGDATQRLASINEDFGHIFSYIEAINANSNGEDYEEESIQRYHYVLFESSEKEKYSDYLRFLKGKVRRLYRKAATRQECLNFIASYSSDLERSFYTLKEIINYRQDDSLGKWLERFFSLGRTANFMPLLLACWIRTKGDPKKLVPILKEIEHYVFRTYSIGGRRADTGIGQLYDLAFEVYHKPKRIDEVEDTLSELIDTYADDTRFEADLKQEKFYEEVESYDIKYLLYAYEKHLAQAVKEPVKTDMLDWLTEKWEVEHIWAGKASVPRKLEDVHEKMKHRLGNLTVASKPWNGKWGKKPFSSKRKEYAGSSLRIQRELAEHKEWGKKQILERQDKLVNFALSRWQSW